MNAESETEHTPHVEPPRASAPSESPLPSNWREALLTLIASRVALFQLESKTAARDAATRIARIVAVVICAFFAWALLLAGVIGAIAENSQWPWFWIAITAAAIHLAAALLLALAAKAPRSPSFPVTRAEFQKDREWIENFHKPRKSND
jgi:uncharacterized membrane protein YqjE